MRAVALERTTKHQTNIGDLYAKHNGRASGPLWSAKIGRRNRVGGTKSTAKLALDPSLVDYISVHQVTGARGACRRQEGVAHLARARASSRALLRLCASVFSVTTKY